ncbi:MAG: hypothetical protein LBG31_00895 [Prevotellaceae bacterium]|nr:hypothetical protein [Prevotellaceae bacterium]
MERGSCAKGAGCGKGEVSTPYPRKALRPTAPLSFRRGAGGEDGLHDDFYPANADVRRANADVRTDDADVRTDDADVRTDDADVRTDDADVRTDDADVRTANADVRRASEIRN